MNRPEASLQREHPEITRIFLEARSLRKASGMLVAFVDEIVLGLARHEPGRFAQAWLHGGVWISFLAGAVISAFVSSVGWGSFRYPLANDAPASSERNSRDLPAEQLLPVGPRAPLLTIVAFVPVNDLEHAVCQMEMECGCASLTTLRCGTDSAKRAGMDGILSEQWLRTAVGLLVRVVEAVGAIVIFSGACVGFLKFCVAAVRRVNTGAFVSIRIGLGRFLALGLEFQLASDLLRTGVAPSFEQIGKLAAVAAIRTALNFFLARELKEERAQTTNAEHP